MASRATRNVAIGLGAWCLVSVPTGLAVGRLLRRGDPGRTAPMHRPSRRRATHRAVRSGIGAR
jgi:hypothetical protein